MARIFISFALLVTVCVFVLTITRIGQVSSFTPASPPAPISRWAKSEMPSANREVDQKAPDHFDLKAELEKGGCYRGEVPDSNGKPMPIDVAWKGHQATVTYHFSNGDAAIQCDVNIRNNKLVIVHHFPNERVEQTWGIPYDIRLQNNRIVLVYHYPNGDVNEEQWSIIELLNKR